MMNTYTKKLERIVKDIKTALPDSDYSVWKKFLSEVYPESELLKDDIQIKQVTVMKNYTDIREIMMLAEANEYPTWYIQPNCKGTVVLLKYLRGELNNFHELPESHNAPNKVEDFTGTVNGIWLNDTQLVAVDTDKYLGFLQKMDWLQSSGFTTLPFALFPTDKIPTTSSHKLTASLRNFMTTEGYESDGVVITSDNPLFKVDDNTSTTQIIFNQLLSN